MFRHLKLVSPVLSRSTVRYNSSLEKTSSLKPSQDLDEVSNNLDWATISCVGGAMSVPFCLFSFPDATLLGPAGFNLLTIIYLAKQRDILNRIKKP